MTTNCTESDLESFKGSQRQDKSTHLFLVRLEKSLDKSVKEFLISFDIWVTHPPDYSQQVYVNSYHLLDHQ